MRAGILGPLEVHLDDAPVELTGVRQRALLTLLLLNAGRVVATERLLEDIWGEERPHAGGTALRVRISQLRKALGPAGALIVTRAPGYMLDLDPGNIDISRFEQLARDGDRAIQSGDAETAASLLHSALDLWRGPALSDFPYETFAQGPARRLEELRLAAREQLIAAELALGRHTRLLSELQELVEEHPTRERLWEHLMVALYRQGRQAEALEAYRSARRRLAEEIGIEPGPRLRALELQILNHDPDLDSAVRTERPARVLLSLVGDRPAEALLLIARALTADIAAELIAAAIVADERALDSAQAWLVNVGDPMVRIAAFTSSDAGRDAVRLATDHDVALLLAELPEAGGFGEPLASLLRGVAADVAVLAGSDREVGLGPVAVPFAGLDHDWAALETGAWLARATGRSLRLVGARSGKPGEDASRVLASASLALQRGLGVPNEYVLADRGTAGMLAASAGAAYLVTGLPEGWAIEGLGEARSELARKAEVPVLFVRRGTSPGGLAPPQALTCFTWTRAGM